MFHLFRCRLQGTWVSPAPLARQPTALWPHRCWWPFPAHCRLRKLRRLLVLWQVWNAKICEIPRNGTFDLIDESSIIKLSNSLSRLLWETPWWSQDAVLSPVSIQTFMPAWHIGTGWLKGSLVNSCERPWLQVSLCFLAGNMKRWLKPTNWQLEPNVSLEETISSQIFLWPRQSDCQHTDHYGHKGLRHLHDGVRHFILQAILDSCDSIHDLGMVSWRKPDLCRIKQNLTDLWNVMTQWWPWKQKHSAIQPMRFQSAPDLQRLYRLVPLREVEAGTKFTWMTPCEPMEMNIFPKQSCWMRRKRQEWQTVETDDFHVCRIRSAEILNCSFLKSA